MSNRTISETAKVLPESAGVCAYDLDECTVTIAFDTEEHVRRLINCLPFRNRVRLYDEEGNLAISTELNKAEGK